MTELLVNTPELWGPLLPRPEPETHKYRRGHTVILGSDDYTGATRLASEACSRIGSGLVTVLSSAREDIYRTTLPADIMVKAGGLTEMTRVSTLLAGPGGCNSSQHKLLSDLPSEYGLVLDAEAISHWSDLKDGTHWPILTPHEGEFARYFPDMSGDREARVVKAAKQANAVMVLKGSATLIAAPNGRLVHNRADSPYLAKAGTGDVLAGMIAGLLAQGMPALEASAAGVWLHGEAGRRIGPGLIPQDIIGALRELLSEVL